MASLFKQVCPIFPVVFDLFMSLCHIFLILTVFQTFALLLYLLQWSVISDLWCHSCNSFVFLAVDFFLLTVCSLCFRHDAAIVYSIYRHIYIYIVHIDMVWCKHGKEKISCDLLYCDIALLRWPGPKHRSQDLLWALCLYHSVSVFLVPLASEQRLVLSQRVLERGLSMPT